MEMARHINVIARQRLEGQPLSRLGPPGLNPTAVHALVFEAVAWTAALRERLQAVTPPAFKFANGKDRSERSPPGRGAAYYLRKEVPNPTPEDEGHNWRGLAQALRLGAGGLAVAIRLIEGLSNSAVVADICDKLKRAAAMLGAGDPARARLATLAAQAMALCAEEAAEAGVKDAADGAGDAGAGEAGSDEVRSDGAGTDSDCPSSSSAEAEDPRLLLPLPHDRRGWSAFADHDDGGAQRAAALDCFVASAPRNDGTCDDGARNEGSCALAASEEPADDDPPPKPPD
jgi:hypothetical protein